MANLTTKESLNRLDDMIFSSLDEVTQELKEVDYDYTEIDLSLISYVTEITAMIYTVMQFTELTEKLIDENILKYHNLTFDELTKMENILIDRM